MSAHQEEEHSYCSDISVNDEDGDLGSVTEADGQEVKNLTRKDNAKVVRMRIVVGSVLVFAGLIVGAASYLYLRRSFQEDGLAAVRVQSYIVEIWLLIWLLQSPLVPSFCEYNRGNCH